MEGIASDSRLIEEMLEVEKNAVGILEEAKEKANRAILQSRSEARRLIEKTREDLQRERDALEHRLHTEGEEEAARIIAEKERAVQIIKEQTGRQREQAVVDLREIVFSDLYVGLCKGMGIQKETCKKGMSSLLKKGMASRISHLKSDPIPYDVGLPNDIGLRKC